MRHIIWLSGHALNTRLHEWGMSRSGLMQCSLLLSLR